MPIPIVLGALALGTAALGVKKGLDAKSNFDTASSVVRRADENLEAAKARLERRRSVTQANLEALGCTKLEVESDIMGRFLSYYRRMRNINYKNLVVNGINLQVTTDELKQMEATSLQAKELAKVGFDAIGAGVLAGWGASTIATTVGVASTGTAIGGLAGAAATNATLAWLGGGALSAGGLGMAGGMAVLGGLVTGPALAVIGFAAAAKSEEALTQAYGRAAQVNVIVEQIENGIALLTAIDERSNEIRNVIRRLRMRVKPVLDQVEELLVSKLDLSDPSATYDYRELNDTEKSRFDRMVLMAMAMNKLLKVNLLNEDGSLNPESEVALDSVRASIS